MLSKEDAGPRLELLLVGLWQHTVDAHTSLAIDPAGTPYVAYEDTVGGKASVIKLVP